MRQVAPCLIGLLLLTACAAEAPSPSSLAGVDAPRQQTLASISRARPRTVTGTLIPGLSPSDFAQVPGSALSLD